MCSNEISQIEEFHSKEALFGNIVKHVWSPTTLLEKGSGSLCLINQGLFIPLRFPARYHLFINRVMLLYNHGPPSGIASHSV